MSKWEGLKPFLLPYSFDYIETLLNKHPIFLKITRERKGKLGDYRPPYRDEVRHKITINGSVNPTQFLITLVHEYAHLEVWVQHLNSVKPHGKEWKTIFIQLMKPLMNDRVFPKPILPHILKHFQNPPASSMRDIRLQHVLTHYYNNMLAGEDKIITVQDIELGAQFTLDNKKIFVKGKLIRKRYLCQEIKTKHYYKVHPLAKVIQVFKDL